MTYGGVPLKPLPHTRGDNLLVVGTSAGQVKPITGAHLFRPDLCRYRRKLSMGAGRIIFTLMLLRLRTGMAAQTEPRNCATVYWARKVYEMLNDRQVNRVFGLLESTGIIEELSPVQRTVFPIGMRTLLPGSWAKLLAKTFNSITVPFSRKKTAGSAG